MLLIEVALRMIECEYYFIGGKEKKRKTGAIYIYKRGDSVSFNQVLLLVVRHFCFGRNYYSRGRIG